MAEIKVPHPPVNPDDLEVQEIVRLANRVAAECTEALFTEPDHLARLRAELRILHILPGER